MEVEKEVKAAKKLAVRGLIIAVVGFVFVLVSLLLGIYGWADLNGWVAVKNLVDKIYTNTQFPVLGSIWKIAAQPNLNEPLQLQNLGFFGEIVVFMIGAAMVGTANRTLADVAKASHDATQERRKEQLKKQQQ